MKTFRWALIGIILGLLLCVAVSIALKESKTYQSWELSPYPDGYNFAFTIIHDADDAYSKRLAPLMKIFDELGMQITVTVFIFHGNSRFEKRKQQITESYDEGKREFFGPRNVPLINETERKFYKEIAAKGHEIALHTPSPTSDTRERIVSAFEIFKKAFGYYPRVYVEHSKKFNKETQWNEGSDPRSPYYSTDLLNRFRCWVWVDGPGALTDKKTGFYDVLKANNTPFNGFVLKKYGILKAFVRTGQWGNSNGDGFLEWYSKENIDSLEKERGTALAYTHLDRKWVDPKTKQIRKSFRNRLAYLTSKKGWFVPVGKILDRFEAMNNCYLSYNKKWLKVINGNSFAMKGVTLISHDGHALRQISKIFRPNKDKKILIGTLFPYETQSFEVLSDSH